MPSREQDWFQQAVRDLAHARHALEDGDFEWACFAAQQASEKAVKAVFQRRGEEAWGHSVAALLEALKEHLPIEEALVDMGKELDTYYIPTRYPNAHPQGAPYQYYTHKGGARAIEYAETIVRLCESLLTR